MKLNDYRKKVDCFDSLTDNKSIEEVEEMVKSLLFVSDFVSSGKILPSALPFMAPTWPEPYLIPKLLGI